MSKRNENSPGYKKTKVGWIPLEWETQPLKHVTHLGQKIVYGIVQAGPHVKNGVPYIRSTDVSGKIQPHNLLKTSKKIAARYLRSEVKPGDLIFSLRGNIGATSIVPRSLPRANLTQGTARISVSNLHCNHFVRYSFEHSCVKRRIFGVSKGSTFKEISLEDLRRIHVPIPPLPEQKKIAKILSMWDEAIEQTRKLIDAKKRRKKALMQQMLTGKNRLPGFNEPWNLHSLGDLTSIVFSNVDKKTFPNEIPVRLCNYTDVYYNEKITEDIPFMMASVTEREIQKYKLRKGDVIITKDSESPDDIAVPCYVAEELDDVVCGYHLAIIRPKKNLVHGSFLSQLLMTNGINYQFFRIANGVTRFGLTLESVKRIKISIPAFDEQRCIAEILQAADGEIRQLEVKLKALEKQKRGLMQKLLTGEVRVSV